MQQSLVASRESLVGLAGVPAWLAPDRPATPLNQPWFRQINSSRWVTGGTTAQALADYVALITALKKEYDTDAPVIAFGGSYGGMLAGWFRIARPDVITGSIAASAPVRMIVSPLQRSLSCRKSSIIPTTSCGLLLAIGVGRHLELQGGLGGDRPWHDQGRRRHRQLLPELPLHPPAGAVP